MAASPMVLAIHRLPFPVLAGLLLLADCLALGAYLAHDTRWPAVGKPGHVRADLGDEFLGAGAADAGDVIELGYLAGERVSDLDGRPGRPAGTSQGSTTFRFTLSRAWARVIERERTERIARNVRHRWRLPHAAAGALFESR